MSEEVSTLRIPIFNGEAKHFQSCCIQFQTYARVKQFNTALKVCSNLSDLEEEIATLSRAYDDEKRKITAGKRNVLAMSHLTMTLGTESL